MIFISSFAWRLTTYSCSQHGPEGLSRALGSRRGLSDSGIEVARFFCRPHTNYLVHFTFGAAGEPGPGQGGTEPGAGSASNSLLKPIKMFHLILTLFAAVHSEKKWVSYSPALQPPFFFLIIKK